MAQKFKRKTIFIKRKYQLKYMLVICFSVILAIAIMFFELTYTFYDVFKEHPALLHPLIDASSQMIVSAVFKLIVYIIALVVISSILSNRIAGPLYKFEKICKEIEEEQDFSKRVFLRKGDEMVELKDDFNSMMDCVERNLKRYQNKKKTTKKSGVKNAKSSK